MTKSRHLFCYLIRGYQWIIRPLLRGQCRFYPSCSHYAIEAFDHHGVRRGFILTAKRLSRCHPWGGHGVDPVPEHGNKQSTTKLINSVKA